MTRAFPGTRLFVLFFHFIIQRRLNSFAKLRKNSQLSCPSSMILSVFSSTCCRSFSLTSLIVLSVITFIFTLSSARTAYTGDGSPTLACYLDHLVMGKILCFWITYHILFKPVILKLFHARQQIAMSLKNFAKMRAIRKPADNTSYVRKNSTVYHSRNRCGNQQRVISA